MLRKLVRIDEAYQAFMIVKWKMTFSSCLEYVLTVLTHSSGKLTCKRQIDDLPFYVTLTNALTLTQLQGSTESNKLTWHSQMLLLGSDTLL